MRKPTRTPAEARRELFESCRACGRTLDSHSWWRLASTVLGEDSHSASKLAALIAARDWGRAALVQEWEGGRDEREYYLVRCPDTKKIALVTVVSTAEMWSDDYVEASEVLGEQDSISLSAIAGDGWKPF